MNKQFSTIVNNSCRRQTFYFNIHTIQINFFMLLQERLWNHGPLWRVILANPINRPYISLRLLNFTIMKLKHHKHTLKPQCFQVGHSHPPAQLISFSIFCFVSSLNGLLLAYICQGKNSKVLMIQREMWKINQHLYPQQFSYILVLAHKFLGLFPAYCTRKAHSVSLSRIAALKRKQQKKLTREYPGTIFCYNNKHSRFDNHPSQIKK
jgi:hypothetical protein